MIAFGIILLILAGITLLAGLRFEAIAWIAAIVAGFAFYFLDWPFGWIGIVAGVIGFVYAYIGNNNKASEYIALIGICMTIVAALVVGPNWGNPFDDDDKKVATNGNGLDGGPGTKNPCADLQDAPACAKSRVKSGQAASVPKRVASANVDVALDTASAAREVARLSGYEVDNTTCSKACVLVGGLLDRGSNNPDEVFITLFAKSVVSPVAVKDFANTVLSGADAEIDDRPAEDPKAFADRINVLAQFFDGAHVTIELQKAGTSVVNTVVHNGKVVQFRYTVRNDRYFIRIEKNDVVLEVFVTCGNRKSAQLIPGAPTTKEEPPHDDKPPETSPTTTTTIRTTTTTLKLKDTLVSTNNNPQILDQVRKDEPSPDNDDEIQEGPIQPVDSPTGCNGPCPAPSTPTTTVPSSSSPPTTIVPSEDRDDYNDGVVLTE